MLKSPIARLRAISLMEGVSFLVLLGIAMPLKYLAGVPSAVKFVGWAHGLLFLIYCALLLEVTLDVPWKLRRTAVVFLAALLPFGPFVIDRRLRTDWAKP